MFRTLIQWSWLAHTGKSGVPLVIEINFIYKKSFSKLNSRAESIILFQNQLWAASFILFLLKSECEYHLILTQKSKGSIILFQTQLLIKLKCQRWVSSYSNQFQLPKHNLIKNSNPRGEYHLIPYSVSNSKHHLIVNSNPSGEYHLIPYSVPSSKHHLIVNSNPGGEYHLIPNSIINSKHHQVIISNPSSEYNLILNSIPSSKNRLIIHSNPSDEYQLLPNSILSSDYDHVIQSNPGGEYHLPGYPSPFCQWNRPTPLHWLHDKPVRVPVHHLAPSHHGRPGVDQGEGGLITLLDISPVTSNPPLILFGKAFHAE